MSGSPSELDSAAITRILPHRFPFLLVDRIVEIDPDRRIVGLKHVSISEHYLLRQTGQAPVLPSAILLELVAQVGAILVLLRSENRDRFIYFMGIDRVRFRRPVRAGETVMVEANIRRMRGRVGQLVGSARVGTEVVGRGSMTFALGPRAESAGGIL